MQTQISMFDDCLMRNKQHKIFSYEEEIFLNALFFQFNFDSDWIATTALILKLIWEYFEDKYICLFIY